MRRIVILAVVLVLLVGGGVTALALVWGGGDKGAVVPLEQVPEPFVKKAKETLPEVKFDHARRLPNGNFEIRGKNRNGKVREVEVNPAGEVVEIE
jgi:hypothetical protein